MSKVRLTCPLCGQDFALESGNVTFLAKHTCGPILCSRPCVEAAEALDSVARPAAAFERLMRRGPESGLRSLARHRPNGRPRAGTPARAAVKGRENL